MRLPNLILAMLTVASLAGFGGAALAQDDLAVTNPQLLSEISLAETRGRTLYAYDQAAWHSTDALVEEIDISKIENPRGYIVVPRATDDMLDTIFVVERNGALREFARYTVDGSKVVSGGVMNGDLPELSPLALRMFEARNPSFAAFAAEEYGLCSESNPNTLTLPPDERDVVAFYLLTSTLDKDEYPLGGHYRADVKVDGTVSDTRRYMNTCFNLPVEAPEGPNGEAGRPGISYLFGAAPSEIHVFASFQFPNGLFVITVENSKLWLIEKGKITLKQENFDVE